MGRKQTDRSWTGDDGGGAVTAVSRTTKVSTTGLGEQRSKMLLGDACGGRAAVHQIADVGARTTAAAWRSRGAGRRAALLWLWWFAFAAAHGLWFVVELFFC